MDWDKFRKTLKMRARLLLLYYIYAVKAQNTAVVQSPELVKVEDGGSVRLQCSAKVVGTYCYTVLWTRIDYRTKRLISLQNIDTNGQEKDLCFFGIKSATVDDSGTYYCSVVHGQMILVGSGSTVIVTQATGNRSEPPPVDILLPRSIQPVIPLLCVVSGVAPSQVRVFWVIDGEEDSGLIQSLWTKDSDEIVESTQNQVLVRADEWERGVVCTCVVEFDGKNISKSVQNEESSDVCTVLLYGAFAAGAGLTIIVAISIAVVLHRGRSVRSDGDLREQRRSAGTEHRHRSGRQGSGLAIDRTISEVQYASLEEASLARRAYVPTV